jgi:hypothetical protein
MQRVASSDQIATQAQPLAARAASCRPIPGATEARGSLSRMHPELEASTEAIAKLHGAELAACVALRDFLLEVVRPWGGRSLDPERTEDALLAALMSRSSNTFWAAVELCQIGFGEQALMLNRSLFDDMVDAHWVTVDPTTAKARYAEHLEHGQMIMYEALAKHPRLFEPDDIPDLDPARRKQLDGVFGEFGNKSWTGIAIHKRVDLIAHLWTDEVARDQLHFFRRVVHRMNNQRLHASAEALNRTLRRSSESEAAFRLGPDGDGIGQALFGAWWTFTQILSLVLDHFEFPPEVRERLAALFNESAPSFRTLSPEDVADVGRNDPCPCGSGKKYKRCHGA